MTSGDGIALSTVVVTSRGFDDIALTVVHLAEQTVRERIELVLVAPALEGFDPDPALLDRFGRHRIVAVGPVTNRAAATAEGIRAATAPIVGMVENHAFPEPGWAEAMLAAHAGPWAGVGPAVEIFNPGSVVSRAERLIDYGHWIAHEEPTEIEMLPWHNATYKRELVMRHEADLEELLDPETGLQARLHAEGHRFYLTPAARLLHTSDSVPRFAYGAMYWRGVEFAVGRSREWGLGRKLVYVAASPLFPLVRMAQYRANVRRFRRRHAVAPLVPHVVALTVAQVVGEVAGYLRGPSQGMVWLTRHELEIELRASTADRRQMDELLERKLEELGLRGRGLPAD